MGNYAGIRRFGGEFFTPIGRIRSTKSEAQEAAAHSRKANGWRVRVVKVRGGYQLYKSG